MRTVSAGADRGEHLLTGAVWAGGDYPPPTGGDDPNGGKRDFCRLMECLLSRNVINPDLRKRLLELGLDLDGLQ